MHSASVSRDLSRLTLVPFFSASCRWPCQGIVEAGLGICPIPARLLISVDGRTSRVVSGSLPMPHFRKCGWSAQMVLSCRLPLHSDRRVAMQ
jgi:hypothetical protein